MAQADYKAFVDRMIERYEGGYGWDRADPGGPTRFGVTCYDLAEYEHKPMNSMAAWAPLVRAMPLSVAEEIYATKYATACDFNALNAGPDCSVFDFGVNSGPSRAVRYAQMVAGVPQDGILGPVTQAAINAMNPSLFVKRHCALRLSFLHALSTWGTFGRGWYARVNDLETYCLDLATPKPEAAFEVVEDAYEAKQVRIPLAFAKAYGDYDPAVA